VTKDLRLHWLTPFSGKLSDLESVNLASVRLRAAVALRAAQTAGWHSSFGPQIDLKSLGDASCVVVGKPGSNDVEQLGPLWIESLAKAKAVRCQILVDYTDHHLGVSTDLSDFYRKLLPLVDAMIVPSYSLAIQLQAYFSGAVLVVPDALEVPITAPVRHNHIPPRALWFGHGTNLIHLAKALAPIGQQLQGAPLELRVLSNRQAIEQFKRALTAIPDGISLRAGDWSLPAMQAHAADCDFCVLPSDPRDPRKLGVSSNRLLTALAMGLPVAASPLASYKEFSEFFVDLEAGGFSELASSPARFHDMVIRAQQTVLPDYLAPSMQMRWLDCLGALMKT
jgi:glycosyltransferase involved in cell wall biosynthesis